MTPQFKKIIKGIYKKGIFHSIKVFDDAISFKNGRNVFSFQLLEGQIGVFSIGTVTEWQELAPTFESEYSSLGLVNRAKFSPFFIEETDSPRFIIRNAVAIALIQ